MSVAASVPTALTIEGSDSGGGAGIQADLKAFAAFGVHGSSALTAITAQNTQGVFAIHAVPPDIVMAQIDAVLSDIGADAIKIGMLASAEIIGAVAGALQRHVVRPLVLDPVMVATSGDRLIAADATGALVRDLFPLAALVTPNLHEAAILTDATVATDAAAMVAQGHRILELGAQAVLMKGGHGTGAQSVDLLVTRTGVEIFTGPRIATANTHGTGCSLSSAIAAGLARGRPLVAAIGDAKAWLSGAIAAGAARRIGAGHGPIHHFHHVDALVPPGRATTESRS